MDCPPHRWRVATVATEGEYPARCARCAAVRTYPADPGLRRGEGKLSSFLAFTVRDLTRLAESP